MKIIAHRGASSYAPENTIEAFQLALEMGSRNFEFDIHRTKDGVLVVHHDYFLLDRKERRIYTAKTSFEDLRKIDVSRLFIGAYFHCVPTLDEVLDIIADKSDWLNIELKNDGNAYPGIEDQIIKVVRQRNIMKKVLFSSFDFDTLKRMRDIATTVPIGLLVHGTAFFRLKKNIELAKSIGAENMHICHINASKKNIAAIRQAGFRCCVYTVNKKKEAAKLKSYGADGIFSNYPDIMGEWNLKP